MLFSSTTFCFVFLPVVLLLYLVSKKEFHNPILLISSIIFYAWGEPRYLAVMLLTILINYLGAISIEKFKNHRKLSLILTVILNLSFLFYFKYFNFLIDNLNNLFNSNFNFLEVIMPIGISFYTFQALSYTIDVFRGEVKAQKDIYKLALYICLFPQLIAGPIIKYHDIEAQIESREVNFEKVSLGVKRFIIGLSKKMLIANVMGEIADKIFAQNPDCFTQGIAWLGSVTYTLQIYFDFSGYSDMAIGLGLIFGFKFMENFNYPYISKSITEFWRRWHISLSTWFKQYVYIPLGGNRGTKLSTLRNLGIVFLLTGVWHGAAWNFVFWGLYNGFFIIIEKIFNIKEFESRPHSLFVRFLQHVYCILIFMTGWVFFRADDLGYAIKYLKNMFGFLHVDKSYVTYTISYYMDNYEIIILTIAILCSIPIFSKILSVKNKVLKGIINAWLIVIFVISASFIANGTYNPFIYFRF